jgi:hypothetical protein
MERHWVRASKVAQPAIPRVIGYVMLVATIASILLLLFGLAMSIL